MSQFFSRVALLCFRAFVVVLYALFPTTIVLCTWSWGSFTCSPHVEIIRASKDAQYRIACGTNTVVSLQEPGGASDGTVVTCNCPPGTNYLSGYLFDRSEGVTLPTTTTETTEGTK